MLKLQHVLASAVLALSLFHPCVAGAAGAEIVSGGGGGPAFLPTGQFIDALVTPGAKYQRLTTQVRPDGNADADNAVSSSVSPDGKTLLVLTSGFNTSINEQKSGPPVPIQFPVLNPLTGQQATTVNQAEYVFVFDITTGYAAKIQQIQIPNTYSGLAWDPNGGRFYVSGGVDDRVLIFKLGTKGTSYVPDAPFLILNHNSNDTAPFPNYDGGILSHTAAGKAVPALSTGALVSGFALSKDGQTLVAANFLDASATVVNASPNNPSGRGVIAEVPFYTPGGQVGHGEYPYGVAVVSGSNGAYAKAYVSSQRDNEVDVITGTASSKVIKVPSGPNKMALSPDQTTLYVACGNDDSIAVINTQTDSLRAVWSLARPGDAFKGSGPNSIAVAPNGKRLYVSLGGENAVAVVGAPSGAVLGRIPAGWYPTSVSLSNNGKYIYITNGKSNGGPNPGQDYYAYNTPYGISLNPTNKNLYTWEIEKGGLVSAPVPTGNELTYLTNVVNAQNGFGNSAVAPIMQYLQTKIQHVIYIVNENRTFDQVFGDIGNGANAWPKLAYFPRANTPNLHALETNFVTLDNFYDSSETSGVGWNWAMQGRTNDFIEKTQPVDYGNAGGRGMTYDWQGIVANMNLGLPPTGPASIFETRITGILDQSGGSTILPGHADPSASEGADDLSPGALGGYIWESALRAGKTIRNYGWQDDLTYYGTGTSFDPPLVRYPYSTKTLQSSPSTPSIRPFTDRYYRAFDQRYPDIFRVEEWNREFKYFVAKGNMPNLMVMTIPHDHFGSLGTALEGLNTAPLQMADHDYAIGQLVEAVSHSPYWGSTAIVIIEDDPQNGMDHVEAHRSIAHVISPYTKSHFLDHTTYTTVSAVRTVEDLLGIKHLGIRDDNTPAMTTVFSSQPNLQPYRAIVPGSLCAPPVDPKLVPRCKDPSAARTERIAELHDGKWWAAQTAGMDFRAPDRFDQARFNRILAIGIKGEPPADLAEDPPATR